MATKITPLIVIAGATASGKSDLALKIAKQFNGEIISADSWTVYKDFNIGTAKPSLKDQKLIKHHLIDIADPIDGFSAAIFKRLATQAIEDITSRGKIAILVGGTGLYIDSVIYDYSFLPPHNAISREKLNSLTLLELLNTAEKTSLDTTAIDKSNKRRIIRLIENDGRRPTKNSLRDNTLLLGIHYDKLEIETRIRSRVDLMVKTGLEQEVNKLYHQYGWDIEPMKGIGYKEWQEYFKGTIDIDKTKESIYLATKKLVKKQETWFKRNKSIHWVKNKREAVELVTTFLGK